MKTFLFSPPACRIRAADMAENNARIAKLKQSFEIFDTDGSGELTAEEVLVILTRMGGPSASQLTEDDAKEFIAEVRSQPSCA